MSTCAPSNLGNLACPDVDPAKTAVIDLTIPLAPRHVSYGELDAMANGVARQLSAAGLQRGDGVGLLAASSASYVAALLGTMRCGLVAVPINTRLPAALISTLCDDAHLEAVFVDEEHRQLCPAAIRRFCLSDVGSAPSFQAVAVSAAETALLLHTSGSSGKPKGVPLSHGGQTWMVSEITGKPELLRELRLLVAAPLYHMNGLIFTFMALYAGATLVLLPRFTAVDYIDAIEKHRCNMISAVPTMLALVARERDRLASADFSSVFLVSIGSAPLSEQLLDSISRLFPAARVANGYGTTETGGAVFGEHPDGLPRPPLSLGYPRPSIRWRFREATETQTEGVLQLQTPAMMTGYQGLPAQTAECLQDGWYDTGDIMRRDEQGFFYFAGRADDMFVCGGENVYPGQVERLLESCEGVLEAAVVPAPDAVKGAIPVAYVVTGPDSDLNAETLQQFCLERGPKYAYPRHVVLLDAMPMAGTNKIDRRALTTSAVALVESSANA